VTRHPRIPLARGGKRGDGGAGLNMIAHLLSSVPYYEVTPGGVTAPRLKPQAIRAARRLQTYRSGPCDVGCCRAEKPRETLWTIRHGR